MKKIGIKQKFGYGMGDLANGLTFGMSSTFLLAFYTDVLGITAVAAGTLFLVARIWDAVNDPLMGALSDKMFRKKMSRAKGRKIEKFRPYLLKGSWPVVAAAILMFTAPSGLTQIQKLAWAYATYILWGMTYTFINIPYGSLAAVITSDPVERSALSVARGIGGLFGGISVRILVPVFLVRFSGKEEKGYFLSMALLGIITLASYLVSYFFTSENVEHKPEMVKNFSFKETFGVIGKNRSFIAVSIASIAMLTGLMINGAMNIYYFRENLNALSLMGLTGLTAVVPMLLTAPVIPRLVKRYGTKKVAWSTSLISAVIFAILFFLPTNVYVYIIVMLAGGFFLMIPNMIVWGQVSDCIDYNQYLSGTRQEGVIYGAYSFVRKIGQALAGFLAGAGLGFVGYTAGAASQSTGTLAGIKFLTIGMPAIGMFIAFAAYKYIWDLTPEKQAEITAAIAADTSETPHRPEETGE